MSRHPEGRSFTGSPAPFEIRQWLSKRGWSENCYTLAWRCEHSLEDEYDRDFSWSEAVAIETYRFFTLGGA